MKRNEETSRLRTGTGRRIARRACGSAVLSLALLAASCSDGEPSEGLSVDNTAEPQVEATAAEVGAETGDDGDGSDITDEERGTAETATETTTEDVGGAGQGAEVILDGGCTLEEAGSQDFYAVGEISDDDPDGGLNVRRGYPAGEVVTTLPEGSLVFADSCGKAEDGSLWYGVVTDDGQTGWASAAFLTTDLPSEPERGAAETEDLVIELLDALAAGRWDDAAELLTFSDDSIGVYGPLLGPPGNDADRPGLADQLEQYCDARLCDAPYEVTDVRGSHMPLLVRPEVDVTFTYPGGSVTQTFSWGTGSGEEFTVDSLPGQSVLAFDGTRPVAADLVTEVGTVGGEVPDGLLDAAEAVRQGLLSETGDRIPVDHLPVEGVAISTHAYLEPEPSNRQTVTEADLADRGDERRLWGYTDGVGEPIVATVDEQLASYRGMTALLEPDVVGVDTRVRISSTIDNLREVLPNGHVVEFHRAGRGQYVEFNWTSVRMVLELRDEQWVVVAIVEDYWTT